MPMHSNRKAADTMVARAALFSASLAAVAVVGSATFALPSTPPHLSRVVQVALTTRDLPRAIAFYRDALGIPLMFETNGMAFFQAGDMRLMVGLARGSMPVGGAVVYFDAGDWTATESALLQRGVRFTDPAEVVERENGREHALREFSDPDGNKLAIMGWRAGS